MTITPERAFERSLSQGPESRMELVSGRLVLGGNHAATEEMLSYILACWGVDAAVPMADEGRWRAALREAFGGPDSDSPRAWHAWAEGFRHSRELPELPPRPSGFAVSAVRSQLIIVFHRLEGGESLGRDFVMRLGDDAFTPDLIFIRKDSPSTLYESHLHGPADIVVELAGPHNEEFLRRVRTEKYAAGRVPELWVVDLARREILFYRLTPDGYARCEPDAEGLYASQGFVVRPAALWKDGRDDPPFIEGRREDCGRTLNIEREEMFDDIRFAPRVGLMPEPIAFGEFMAWAPEGKFEWWDGKPQIGGGAPSGTRNVLGMLLMTCGLTGAVRLRHPQEWLAALERRRVEVADDARRKATVWEYARAAADVLRRDYGREHVGVVGDLVRAEPLDFWSSITLVIWGEIDYGRWPRLWEQLREAVGGLEVEVVEAEKARGWMRRAIAEELVEL